MTIFEYALLRAARQKMTPDELGIAQRVAELAERGEPGARELLRKMVHDVLNLPHYRPRPAAQEELSNEAGA
jgi:hypothetical protein